MDSQANGQHKDSIKGNSITIRVLPSFYFLPETRIAAGALAYTLFNWNRDTSNRVSNTQHYLSFTQNRQVLFEHSWQLFTNNNRWIWRGSADFSLFPEYYFGIGNHAAKPDKVLYSSRRYVVKNHALRNFGSSVYMGLSGHFERMGNIRILNGANPDYLKDLQSYHTFGIGPAFVYDNRDFVVTPTRGSLLEGSYLFFTAPGWHTFSILSLDYRYFMPFNAKKSVIGIQAIFRQGFGKIPFRLLPGLGGADFLRGSYAGRFRDQMILGIQAECRTAVYKRVGLAVFAGFGHMGSNVISSGFKPKGSMGLGLRYRLRKNENVNLRIDFAKGLQSNGIYIVLAEAF